MKINVQRKLTTEVVVVGGGTAGVFAAISSAALAAQNNVGVSEVDYKMLCAKLKNIGAIIPE